jgi:hypothetical protein
MLVLYLLECVEILGDSFELKKSRFTNERLQLERLVFQIIYSLFLFHNMEFLSQKLHHSTRVECFSTSIYPIKKS